MLEAVLALALATGIPPGPPPERPATADTVPWSLTVATWNLLNFGDRKAGLPPYQPELHTELLDRYAGIMSQYDIVVVQELLDSGRSLTEAVAQRAAMSNYNCSTVSRPSGRAGRPERYGICYVAALVTLDSVHDYMGTTVTALDTTQQTAQDVWMRPPLRAAFTYTTPDGTPFQFSVYDSHTKPGYSEGARPPGTPPDAPRTSSVTNELTSLEQNLATLPDTIAMIAGDLNADCASYPQMYWEDNFQAPWTWYVNFGEKTNTAPRSSCAYDRIILSDSLNVFYLGYGIYPKGIDGVPLVIADSVRLNGRRVSDHFPVWVRLGVSGKRKQELVASTSDPLSTEQRDFEEEETVEPSAKVVKINGMNFSSSPAVTSSKVFIVKHDPMVDFAGNQTYPLTDVRGAPTPVKVGADGSFTENVVWTSPVKGIYNLVLDVNGDGRFNKNDGDFANYANQVDVIVQHGRAGHNDVVTLDDRGAMRGRFNTGVAQNVYALAQGLRANDSVDAYVVSTKLLPPGFTWEPRVTPLVLSSVSIPVNVQNGPIMVSQLTAADKRQRLPTSPEGTLFAAVWQSPFLLMNTPVFTVPPAIPVYKPEYLLHDTLGDPCENAWMSTDANFKLVCNVGNQFSDYYGNAFNVVLDVDRDGVWSPGDKVDTYDTADMAAYFNYPSNTALDARADGNPAVSEYKEYLNAKLNLFPPLIDDNIYASATMEASAGYQCMGGLPRSRFPLVQKGAQVGFEMFNQEDYLARVQLDRELYSFDEVNLSGSTVSANTTTCMTASVVRIGDLTVESGATATIVAEHQMISGTVTVKDEGLVCHFANGSLRIAANTSIIAQDYPDPITSGILHIFSGGASLVGSVVKRAAC